MRPGPDPELGPLPGALCLTASPERDPNWGCTRAWHREPVGRLRRARDGAHPDMGFFPSQEPTL